MTEPTLEPGKTADGGEARDGAGGEAPGPPFQMARLGIWLFLGSLTMLFGALALIYVVRLSDKADYPFEAPPILWLSTLIIVVSSVSCEGALRAVRRGDGDLFLKLLGATLGLGLLFVASQVVAWTQLWPQFMSARDAAEKVPFLNLFYIITVVHAVHLVGGLGWAGYAFVRARRGAYAPRSHLAIDLGTTYWHFMDVVWLVFFALLMFL